ncbi:hypothetical protein HYALB_00002085 [Hymenoscyphus albidus]|uniref:Uncharacterized protein n=1 Tax=Hymenoscyphus albidus TaxID=595503 RepID=A0A9N9LF93_9HELO|nr:hypothetical protein HYALB_00002085 [Hymenoscyphus albidus]
MSRLKLHDDDVDLAAKGKGVVESSLESTLLRSRGVEEAFSSNDGTADSAASADDGPYGGLFLCLFIRLQPFRLREKARSGAREEMGDGEDDSAHLLRVSVSVSGSLRAAEPVATATTIQNQSSSHGSFYARPSGSMEQWTMAIRTNWTSQARTGQRCEVEVESQMDAKSGAAIGLTNFTKKVVKVVIAAFAINRRALQPGSLA